MVVRIWKQLTEPSPAQFLPDSRVGQTGQNTRRPLDTRAFELKLTTIQPVETESWARAHASIGVALKYRGSPGVTRVLQTWPYLQSPLPL